MTETPWKTSDWYVSHYNYAKTVLQALRLPQRVGVHDITLRDGEQQANIVFRKDEKVRIARMLDEVGVSRIEAGLPAVSDEDFMAVKEIAKSGLNAKVYSFSRCMTQDVDLALKCDVDGVVMEIPSSDHFIKHGYGWTVEKAIDLSVEATKYAADHGLRVVFFTIDSTRAEFDTFLRLINAVASKGHMDALAVVDTFGGCSPGAISYFVSKIKEKIKKPLEIHCHNDFGLAVANTLAAVAAGVEVVHTTVNGIGERMGNASMAEVALALRALYNVDCGIKFEKLRSLSKLVETLSGVRMPPNKAVDGDGIYTIESGLLASFWSRLNKQGMPLEMFPYSPSLVGHDPVRVALGKKSGRDSVLLKIKEMGIDLSEAKVDELLAKIKLTALEMKRTVTDEEFLSALKKISSTT